jgi:hypothetical protein
MIEANRFETIVAPAPEGTPPTTRPVDTSSTRRDGVLERCVRRQNGLTVCQEPAHALAGEREKAIATGCEEFDTKHRI